MSQASSQPVEMTDAEFLPPKNSDTKSNTGEKTGSKSQPSQKSQPVEMTDVDSVPVKTSDTKSNTGEKAGSKSHTNEKSASNPKPTTSGPANKRVSTVSTTSARPGSNISGRPFSLTDTLSSISTSAVPDLPPHAALEPAEVKRARAKSKKRAEGRARAKARAEEEALTEAQAKAEALAIAEEKAWEEAVANAEAYEDMEAEEEMKQSQSENQRGSGHAMTAPKAKDGTTSFEFSKPSPVGLNSPRPILMAEMDTEAEIRNMKEEIKLTHKLIKERDNKIQERNGQIEELYELIRQRDENAAKMNETLQRRAAQQSKLISDSNQLARLEKRFAEMEQTQARAVQDINDVKAENQRLRKELSDEKRVNKEWSERNLVLENERRNVTRKCQELETVKTALQERIKSLELETSQMGQEKAKILALLEQALRDVESRDQELLVLREEQSEAMDTTETLAINQRSVSAGTHGSLQDELAEVGESLGDLHLDGDSHTVLASDLAAKLAAADAAHAQTKSDLTAALEQLAAVEAQRDVARQEAEKLRGLLAAANEEKDFFSSRLEQAITSAKERHQAQQGQHTAGLAQMAAEHLEIREDLQSKLAARDRTVGTLEAQIAAQDQVRAKELADLAASKDAEVAKVKSELGAADVKASQVEEEAERAHQAKLAAVETAHQERLDRMEEQHQTLLEEERRVLVSRANNLQQRVVELHLSIQEAKAKVAACNEAHGRELAALRAERDSALDERDAARCEAEIATEVVVVETDAAPATAAPGFTAIHFVVIVAAIIFAALWGAMRERAKMRLPGTVPAASGSAVCGGVGGGAGWRVGAWVVGTGVGIEDLVVGFYG